MADDTIPNYTVYGSYDDLTAEERAQLDQTTTDTGAGTGVTTVATNAPSDGELATVEASANGDIVNGEQTGANPTTEQIATQVTTEDYSNSNKGLQASSVGTPQRVISNPLHGYATYTYSLSLHMMTDSDYNMLMTDSSRIYVPTNVLIASAGRYNNSNFIRNPAFQEDFYFEDFKMNSVIGMTPMNRSTNVIDVSFTIIEPNGFSFINRLLDAATNLGIKNYLEIPYMLQIDFYGSTDAGDPAAPIPGQTKYIPIRLTGVKSKVSAKGAEYRVTGVAFNHIAHTQMVATAPAHFQIRAATVRDFFGSGVASGEAVVAVQDNERAEAERAILKKRIDSLKSDSANATANQQQISELQQQYDSLATINQVYTLKEGYTNAINGWYQYLLTKQKRLTQDQVVVIIDPEIANATVVNQQKNDVQQAGNAVRADKSSVRAQTGIATGGPRFTEGYFAINAGTAMDKVIEMVVRNSDYIIGQLTEPTADNPETIAQKLGRPLRWFKIVPKVLLGEYDPIIGQYSKKYIYYVKPWTVSNKVPVAPMGKAAGFVKKYEYIYTGQNSDILDVNLDFDMLYFMQLTANKTENQETQALSKPQINVIDQNFPEIYPAYTVNPKATHYVSQDVQYSGQMSTISNPKALAAGDLHRNLTKTARGDMINVKLTILGDPTFIKQDDMYYGQTSTNMGMLTTPNGSLIMDEGELYVLLIFNSPTDYNEQTGLLRNDRYRYSMFSGVYGVTTIENTFNKGKFTQTLSLYRLFNQPQFDDMFGGQYSQVFQLSRIESQMARAALSPIQGAIGRATNRIYQSVSGVMTVVTAAMQLVQNAERIAMGLATAVLNNVVNKAVDFAMKTVTNTIIDPIKNQMGQWWDSISTKIGDWWDDVSFKADIFLSGNWNNYTSEYLVCTKDSLTSSEVVQEIVSTETAAELTKDLTPDSALLDLNNLPEASIFDAADSATAIV